MLTWWILKTKTTKTISFEFENLCDQDDYVLEKVMELPKNVEHDKTNLASTSYNTVVLH